MTMQTLPSSLELLQQLLLADAAVTTLAQGGVIGDATTQEQKQAGVVELAKAGTGSIEQYLPLMRDRISVRCVGPDTDYTDRLSRAVQRALHQRNRVIVTQPSTNERFLVHSVSINGGPTAVRDDDNVWGEVMFAELLVGTEEVQ